MLRHRCAVAVCNCMYPFDVIDINICLKCLNEYSSLISIHLFLSTLSNVAYCLYQLVCFCFFFCKQSIFAVFLPCVLLLHCIFFYSSFLFLICYCIYVKFVDYLTIFTLVVFLCLSTVLSFIFIYIYTYECVFCLV